MFKVTMMRRWQCAAGAALLVAAGAAQAQWMWIDAKGLKQVSDRPPPASVPSKNILKAPMHAVLAEAPASEAKPAVAAAAPDTAAPAAAASAAAPKGASWTEREAEFRKRKADQAAAEKKAEEGAAQAGKKDMACKDAQTNKARLDAGERIRTGPGRAQFMTEKERGENTAAAASFIARNCQ